MLEVMSRQERRIYWFFVSIWIVANLVFWQWWFRKEHVVSLAMFALTSLALFYETTFLPSAYLFFVEKMKKPKPIYPPKNLKVAMVTLCVPSKESMEVIERQLETMVRVCYSHDSWVLDEENNPQVKTLANRLGIKYFSRKGIEKYNQPHPPFQAKTKAGNVNAWLDAFGWQYDFFTQLDIDHNPSPDYLDMVLGYFINSEIAWVQAPSIYGNLEEWTARGAAEQELVLQGPLQMGFYGWNQRPFILGSHTTYRTRAVLEINGFQPTRAEDHLDTIVLTAYGYKGVFVPEPIAVGDGPETFETYLAQQFAWAYSMIQVLLFHMPRHLRCYSVKQAAQFLFSETWYPLWSTSMAILFLMPCLALLTNIPIATMAFGKFLVRYLPVWTIAFGFWFWTKRWFKPKGLSLSWRGIVLHVARWPIVLWAFLNVILGIKKPYMITPKGMARKGINLKTHTLYFGLIGLSLLAAVMFLANPKADKAVSGYLLFAIEGILLFSLIFVTNFLNALPKIKPLHVITLLLLCAAIFSITWASSPHIANAISWNASSQVIAAPTNQQALLEMIGENISQPVQPDNVESQEEVKPTLETRPTAATTPTNQPLPPTPIPLPLPISLGVYDPKDLLDEVSGISLQHDFVPWFQTERLSEALEKSRKLGRFPLISLEPWPLLKDNLTAETLLQDINAGEYDQIIKEDATVIKSVSPQSVLVRWGHEMELTELYPWSGDPVAYISAYRRVVDIFRARGVQNVRWVWSPAGNSSADKFYPGDKYVDYVGVTILADYRWDQEAGFSSLRSFETLLREKYWLAEEFNKPLIAAEVGVSIAGSSEKRLWLLNAQKSFSLFPRLVAFVYFNDINAHAPGNYRPNWCIDQQIFKELVNEVSLTTLPKPTVISITKGPLLVETPVPIKNQTVEYVVKKGDSLLSIAQRFYGDWRKWRTIYEVNQGIIKNPNLLYPGQVLIIPR